MDKERIEQGICVRERILEFIIGYLEEHGYPPTMEEIGKGVGLSSKSSVHLHIKLMIDVGALETDASGRSPRAIRVPGYRFVKV